MIKALGSGVDGTGIDALLCARLDVDEVSSYSCPNKGVHLCSGCQLVKYCSRDCQRYHWKAHRRECKHFYASKDWEPTWIREKRSPAFFGSGPTMASYGRGAHYLWGNLTAYDCLNLELNEGHQLIDRDFSLCFAASGDLRNVVKTINSLPQDYQGTCTVVMNDINPYVTIRNLLLLSILCDKSNQSVDEVAEAALHYTYSAAITASQSQYLSSWMSRILDTINPSQITHKFTSMDDDTATVTSTLSSATVELLRALSQSTYELATARKDMVSVTRAMTRVDYRDRQLGALRPPHRVVTLKRLDTGMMLPFSNSHASFTEPNRILFDEEGKWLLPDSADPLQAFDVQSSIVAGERRHIPSADLYGCLFAYLKDEFSEFVQRTRRFKLRIEIYDHEMCSLANLLQKDSSRMFDRIDTSNVMDSIGIKAVITAWAPLLNRENNHACLLAYSMNWIGRQPGGMPDQSLNSSVYEETIRKAFEHERNDPNEWTQLRLRRPQNRELNASMALLMLPAFYDNGPPFERFLKAEGVPKICPALKIKTRTVHRILPKRRGIPLSIPELKIPKFDHETFYNLKHVQGVSMSERFIEFESDNA